MLECSYANSKTNIKQVHSKETERQKYQYCAKMISKVRSENIELILRTQVETIKELGCKIRQTSFLEYPDYVIFRGLETVIDTKRMQFILKLSICTVFFTSKGLSQTGKESENYKIRSIIMKESDYEQKLVQQNKYTTKTLTNEIKSNSTKFR